MIISSKSNDRIKRIASLKEKKFRIEYCQYIVEGRKMVKEAYLSGKEILTVVGTESALCDLSAELCLDLSEICDDVIAVTESVFKYISDSVTPQGIMAVLKIEKSIAKPNNISVLLDGISDPGNMGTIIRTMAAADVKNLYLVNCCDPYSPKAVRASMSGIYFVDISEIAAEDVSEIFKGTPIIVADMGGESVYGFTPPENYCLVIGGEANGVSADLKSKAEKVIAIPMSEHSESLNAGVSLSVILYELRYGK